MDATCRHLDLTRGCWRRLSCRWVGKHQSSYSRGTITLSWILICSRPAPDALPKTFPIRFVSSALAAACATLESWSRLDLLRADRVPPRRRTAAPATMNVQSTSDTDDGDAAELSKLTGMCDLTSHSLSIRQLKLRAMCAFRFMSKHIAIYFLKCGS